MMLQRYIDEVFPEHALAKPQRERLLPREAELRALAASFQAAGYFEFLPRSRQSHGIEQRRPNFHYESFDGELCYAKYVRLFVRSGAVVLLPVSYVAPVYSVTDFLYPDDTNGAVHDLRQWVETPEVAEVEKLAQLVLTRLQMTYVPWNDPSLDEPVHRSVPRSNVRDFLFHFEDYD